MNIVPTSTINEKTSDPIKDVLEWSPTEFHCDQSTPAAAVEEEEAPGTEEEEEYAGMPGAAGTAAAPEASRESHS